MNKENISTNIPHHDYTKHTSEHKHITNTNTNESAEDLKHLSLSEIKAINSCKICQAKMNPNTCHATISMENCTCKIKGFENFSKGMQVVIRDLKGLSNAFSITMAIKLNIFEIIKMYNNNTFMCMKEIRSLIKGNNMTERDLRDLMMVLVSQGLLDVSGEFGSEKFRNTELTEINFLSSSSANCCKAYLNLEKFMTLYSDYSKNGFTHLHRLNHSNSVYYHDEDAESDLDYFYKANELSFNKMLELVDFSKFQKLTDIRGGSGKYAMELKEKNPDCEIRSFDKPSLEKFVLRNIEHCPSEKSQSCNISALSGNLVNDSLPESDCVLAPHIFMHFNCENLKSVFKNVCACIRPSGQLVILENLLHGDKSDSTTYGVSFMMQVLNCEGFARTFDEFKCCLLDAGFKSVERKEMGAGLSDLIICQK